MFLTLIKWLWYLNPYLLHCRAVHYLGEKDQDDDFAVLYDINL